MPGLRPDQCYQVCKPVDLGPVLSILDRLQFIGVNQGGADTSRYPCFVVLSDKFPPEVRALVDSLKLGGRPGRAILRKLMPRQSIPEHVDAWMPGEANWRRFQVPITSHPEIRMRWPDDGLDTYLMPGFLYEVRYDRPHEVVHRADIERIHLQVDQIDATI
jgi:hypothetical protein